MTPSGRIAPRAEDGFALIEVLVSALILAIVAAGVMALLQTTTHSAAAERRHAEAYALAQENQARLRSMRLSALNRYSKFETVTVGDDEFTVESQGVFVNNSNGQPSTCKSGETSADYVRITSTVSWSDAGKPVTIQSIVSPSNGSLDPNHGTLIVTTQNQSGEPVSGVGLSATGAGSFSGTTDSTGCAYFTDLPSGSYTVTPSGTGLVDKNGNAPKAESTSVIAGGSATLPLVYDHEAKIPIAFKYRSSTGTFEPATGDSVFVYNQIMVPAGKAYWTTGKTRQHEFLVAPVFPYSSPVTLYPGVCEKNNPGIGAGQANITLKAGTTYSPTVELQEPALEVTVKNGSTAITGAKVKITDEVCTDAEAKSVIREYTTEAQGHQSSSTTGKPELGLPYSTYKVCASATISGSTRRKTVEKVSVQSLTSTKAVTIDLSSETKSGSCP